MEPIDSLAVPSGVTAVLLNFEAVSEFWHHSSTCGETAFLVLEHCKDGIPLTGPAVDAVYDAMARAGYSVIGGTIMSDLVDFFRRHRGLDIDYVNKYGSSWDQIHATLLSHAGRDGCVIEVENASALTDSERGVHRHYVAIGGIHPTKGYLVANGDDIDALARNDGHGHLVPTRWMSKAVIQASQPRACAVVRGLEHVGG